MAGLSPGLRLVPRSLFARMVLVMLAGLVLAQVLATLLLFDERTRWFLQGRIARSSHRMADAVRVLEAQPPALRASVARGFATQEFEIAVLTQPAPRDASAAELAEAAQNLQAELAKVFGGADVSVQFDAQAAPPPRGYEPFSVSVPATRVQAQIASADGAHRYALRLKLPADTRGIPDRVLWELALRLLLLLALLLVAVRWATRPLSVLAKAADRLGRNLDEPPIPERGPSEVVQAAQAFNQMQTRVRDLVRQKGQMLAAVSHDLKTPITRLRLRAEMLGSGELREKIGRDLDEMESMVGATLELMRGSGAAEPLQRTDLLALVESLQADYEDMGHRFEVQAARVAPVELRPQAIRRCLANLIDNAIKYGEQVRVVVEDQPHAVRVRVEDRGPGLDADYLERVFEPFFRMESSRNRESGGSGLGLSIARAIAVEHAGSLRLQAREGGGLCALLELPRA